MPGILLPASEYQADHETRTRNESRQGSGHEPCFLCGRPLTDKAIASAWWIEMTTSNQLIPNDDRPDGLDSQGSFPLGSECAKRVPRSHRSKMVG